MTIFGILRLTMIMISLVVFSSILNTAAAAAAAAGELVKWQSPDDARS
jgi:hypothetical protein